MSVPTNHNSLLNGLSVNLRAGQAVYALAALIDKSHPQAEITVNADDLLNFVDGTLGEEREDSARSIEQLFTHLNQHPIVLPGTDGSGFVRVNWLSHLELRAGKIHAQFTPKVTEYLLQNHGTARSRLLEDLRLYKSKFTARILRLFQQKNDTASGEREFVFSEDINELKRFFQVEEKYRRFFDFERFVLLVTRKELAENDILPFWFSFEKIKEGRSIKQIRFTVYVRPKVLSDVRPQLRSDLFGEGAQRDIFDEQRAGIFDAEQKKIFAELTRVYGIGKAFAQNTLTEFTNEQAQAYLHLIKFGLNKTTAFSLLKKFCQRSESGGEEAAVLRMIEEVSEIPNNRTAVSRLEKLLNE